MTIKQVQDLIVNDSSLNTVKGAKNCVDKADKDLIDAVEKTKNLFANDWGNKSFKTFLEVSIKVCLWFSVFSSIVSIIFHKPFYLFPIAIFIALMVTQFIYTVVAYSKYINKIEKSNKEKKECYYAWFLAHENYTKVRYEELLNILLKYRDTKSFSKEDFDLLKQMTTKKD